MSRVGRSPISVSNNVTVTLLDNVCKVVGPKGELSMNIPYGIEVKQDNDQIIVSRKKEDKKSKALHGTIRNKIRNMVVGVTEGFVKNLLLVGTGYRVKLLGKNLELSLGFSHPVIVNAVDGIEFKITDQDKIAVIGFDKEVVGQMAANIRSLRPPEPYKGKGIRYKNEVIIKKAGKTSKGE